MDSQTTYAVMNIEGVLIAYIVFVMYMELLRSNGLISLLCQTLAVSHMLTLELLSQNLHEKWQSFSLYKSFNVCICFSIKLILLSLNNSQLCIVNSTVFKRQPLRNFFLKHKDILISNLATASPLLQFIHIASCLIQPSLDEGHWII